MNTLTPNPPAPTGHGGPDAHPDSTGSRAGRRAWLAVGAVLAVLSLLWGTFSVLDLLAHEESVQTSTYASEDITRLDVRNDDGSVTVTPGSGDSVSVRTEISEGLGGTTTSERLVSGVLELRSECPTFGSMWCSVDYIVELPADRAVEIDAQNGAVVVRGLTGDVVVDNDNGIIVLDDMNGNVRVSNDNGGIVGTNLASSVFRADNQNGSIELSFREAPDAVTVSNSNGSIDVIVPDTDVAYRVDLRSGNGGTTNDVRSDPASDRTIELSTDNGSISVRPGR